MSTTLSKLFSKISSVNESTIKLVLVPYPGYRVKSVEWQNGEFYVDVETVRIIDTKVYGEQFSIPKPQRGYHYISAQHPTISNDHPQRFKKTDPR